MVRFAGQVPFKGVGAQRSDGDVDLAHGVVGLAAEPAITTQGVRSGSQTAALVRGDHCQAWLALPDVPRWNSRRAQ